MLETLFPSLGEMTVLDFGGDARFWRSAPVRPAHVTLLNTFDQAPAEPWISAVVGDACDPPGDLPAVDLAFSNSVIEHVGGHWRREQLAASMRGAAPHYWVQTPYRYFPIEPHYLCPGVQFLPLSTRPAVLMKWPLGHANRSDSQRALEQAMSIELLDATQMRAYFPDADLHREKFAGLTKSLISVRQ